MMIKFQSTHPLRGATPVAVNLSVARLISIHAPLAGCDASHRRDNARHGYFNPRTPCGVRRRSGGASARCARFQSTHPLRGATPPGRDDMVSGRHFNPRTPCGVRHGPLLPAKDIVISIHAPLAGCDCITDYIPPRRKHFNPRTPCGVRQVGYIRVSTEEQNFNPRTPCGVRPPGILPGGPPQGDFNPRTPCGVRHEGDTAKVFACQFQSTHPLRGATR